MKEQSLIKELDIFSYKIITEKELEELKDSLILVLEEDTLISGFIRIFKYNDFFIFQEKTPKNEIIIRKFNNSLKAKNLLNQRLEVYEKMWNGCGCKINYY